MLLDSSLVSSFHLLRKMLRFPQHNHGSTGGSTTFGRDIFCSTHIALSPHKQHWNYMGNAVKKSQP